MEFYLNDADLTPGEDQMVCGTLLLDGTPVRFLMPKDADDEMVRDAAFEIRHKRPMSAYEKRLLEAAVRMRAAS